MNRIAIIGTAGRDKTKPMTAALWQWMVKDAMARVPKGAHVVSGGAAWADHLAVVLFLWGHAAKLTLHLPAPFIDGHFDGLRNSSASAANYYHQRFGQVIGRNTLAQIEEAAAAPNCDGTFEPYHAGYAGMFARNVKVARCEEMLAYTFGPGNVPADGGTKDTWDKCKGLRTHVSLPLL